MNDAHDEGFLAQLAGVSAPVLSGLAAGIGGVLGVAVGVALFLPAPRAPNVVVVERPIAHCPAPVPENPPGPPPPPPPSPPPTPLAACPGDPRLASTRLCVHVAQHAPELARLLLPPSSTSQRALASARCAIFAIDRQAPNPRDSCDGLDFCVARNDALYLGEGKTSTNDVAEVVATFRRLCADDR